MTHRWILRGAAVVLPLAGIAFVAGIFAFVRLSHARQTSLEKWNHDRCVVYRTSVVSGAEDPCLEPSDVLMMPAVHEAHGKVETARGMIARGDDAAAARELATALDKAAFLEKRSSVFGTNLAARVAGEVLDVLDANPRVARQPAMRAALLKTKLATTLRPLEAHRLRVATAALRATPKTAMITWGATHMRVADAIEREDGALLAMQHAARSGNRTACEAAAARSKHLTPDICRNLVETTKVGHRLERARLRATIIPE